VNEDYNSYESLNNSDTSYYDYIEYKVRKPLVLSGGISAQFNNAEVTADLDYTDWSQLEYGGNSEMETYNNDIKSYYTDVLRIRLGGEYVFPRAGLSLRAGYFRDPLPIKSSFINKNRNGFTLGAGILLDQVMTIDLAFVHGSYGRNSDFFYANIYDNTDSDAPIWTGTYNLVVDEDISYNRLFLTAAYRF